jgi:hypothetical protein
MRAPPKLILAALGLVVGAACKQPNASHCANLEGNPTCNDRGYDYCNTCIADNDGCTNDAPPAQCGGGIAGTGTGTSSGDATTHVPGTSTGTTAPASSEEVGTAGPETSTGESPCGNGSLDEGEDCDGDAGSDATCESRGFPGGILACDASCLFDESGCNPVMGCPNGVLEEGEDCEPAMDGEPEDLGGATCSSVGNQFDGDGLFCNPNCTFNTSGCCLASGQTCGALPCCGQCTAVLCTDAASDSR